MKLSDLGIILNEVDQKKLSPQDIEALGGLSFFHGGTKFSGDVDPTFFGTGEPGNLRPQGQAFYGGNKKDLADIYQKYGQSGSQGTTEFRISEYALLYPVGSTWRKMSLEYTGRIEDAIKRAEELLKQRGLAKKDSFRDEYIHPIELYTRARGREAQEVRQTLIDAGIDGSVTYLNDMFDNEIAIYNTKIISRV